MYTKPESTHYIDPKQIPPPRILSGGRMLVTDEQRAFMVKMYLEEGLSTWRIGKLMGYLNVCIINNLKKAGVKLRNRSDAAKQFEVKRDYFKEINTHTKAYLLGLFYADGNIHKDSFTIALQEPDKHLLEAISKEIGMTGELGFRSAPKKYPHRQSSWALRVYDKEFCSHLKKWGVVARKTSQLKFPSFLNKEFLYSFLHGLLDGDGHIGYNNKAITAEFAGAPQMTIDIKNILENELNIYIERAVVKNSKGTKARCRGKHALVFLYKMYTNSRTSFFLDRKKNRYVDYLRFRSSINSKHKSSQAITEITTRHLKIFSTICESSVS